MNLIITGANGFLGQHLTAFFAGKGFTVMGVSRGQRRIPEKINIIYQESELTSVSNVSNLRNLFENFQPAVIIHTAAMSKPDECDALKEQCLLNNVKATGHLVQFAKELQAHFIQISTDFIFGENGPHAEEAIPNPLNFYGQSKLMAEELVMDSGLPFTIIRPVFIYGKLWEGMRPSFLHWVKQNLEQGKKIKVVTDQVRTPTYVEDICRGIETVVQKKITGKYHLAGKDSISPYQMALTVAEVLRLNQSLIEPVTADTFPETVIRAKKSGLLIHKAQKELGYEPVSFTEGVRLTFDR
ncbi:MAG: SDR family oxidoreductase [Sediminibacterium sp.]|nr:SDR family oxidoreductase [Sediminibacterium sp.]MDP3129227.1 SDR family oxidoreductase [Sediminibacterium sp.]